MGSASPSPADQLFSDVLGRAIKQIRRRRTPVYTFAFYHDHESAAVSVCVDTAANSREQVARMNAFNRGYFLEAVADRDLETAALFKTTGGRSLSLGDFALVNLARTNLGQLRVGKTFYLSMIEAVLAHEETILALAPDPAEVLFCCSGADDEVQYTWPAETTEGA